jgi:superfamily II DNA or RNA helicase/HKD family nuclease
LRFKLNNTNKSNHAFKKIALYLGVKQIFTIFALRENSIHTLESKCVCCLYFNTIIMAETTNKSKFFTNEDTNTLLNKIEGVFQHKNIHYFDALVGYFRASGYFRIRPFVEKAQEIRILVGINIDKLVAQASAQGVLFDPNAEKSVEDFYNSIKKNVQDAEYDKTVEDGMLQMIQDIVSKKVIIRVHPKQNIHAKIYIFREAVKHYHGYGSVITGSSNLTDNGLQRNFEFNVELREDNDIEFATETFEKLWIESVEVNDDFVDKLKRDTYLNDSFTPYEIYLKLLQEYFKTSINFDPNSYQDLPHGFKKLNYQIDAVHDGFNKMIKHNGFFLADVVGLGKTVVGTLIAKKYFNYNSFKYGHINSTLIIAPPALKENWEETLEKFGFQNYKIITSGSLHKVNNPEKYDLVIIDEAHKFRSDTSEMYRDLQNITKTPTRIRTENEAGEEIRIAKKVILISATPLNNTPSDIANLVYIFKDAKDAPTLEISNLQHFFRKHIDAFNKIKQDKALPIEEVTTKVREIYENIRTKVIEPLTVRRTRRDLKDNKPYFDDLQEQGINFPDVQIPQKIYYELDTTLDFLYDETIKKLGHPTLGLNYNRYRAIGFLTPIKKSKYRNADLISTQLAKIMKTLLIKRLDSSFFAFKQSLKRFLEATNNMVTMFENNRIYIAPNVDVNTYLSEGKEEELIELLSTLALTDPTIEVCNKDDFEEGFERGLRNDQSILQELVEAWDLVQQDPKLEMFMDYLENRLLKKEINHEGKLVVFSESKETTTYLQKALKEKGVEKILVVDSSNRKDKMPSVRANFDANLPIEKRAYDYDIIISTEVLAEGVNLHRSNVILNYDTPWNATRLMQRIGRVNRIGSVADKVHIFNFFPTAKVDKDIDLEKKALMKLTAFHVALGEDSQIFSADEPEPTTFGIFDKDVDEEKDEKLKYLFEIRKIKQEEPELFKRIKNMPLRARVGRKSKVLKGSTIAFIRNEHRDAFFHVKDEENIEELTFLEAVREFEAKPPEQAIPLHEQHHEQVKFAIKSFAEKLEELKGKDRKIDNTQGPNEKKALKYLDAFLDTHLASDEEQELIKKAKKVIGKAKFQHLQRDINKMERNLKKVPMKPVARLEALMQILKSFPLDKLEESDMTHSIVNPSILAQFLDPNIIISESFNV